MTIDQEMYDKMPENLRKLFIKLPNYGSEEVLDLFPDSSITGKRTSKSKSAKVDGTNWLLDNHESQEYTDSGSTARFFYHAKANAKDRAGSKHPTIKPVSLIQWLARLITPPGGTVLDPFAGSGTCGAACDREGFKAILIERETEYQDDIRNRMNGKQEIIKEHGSVNFDHASSESIKKQNNNASLDI